MKRKHIVEAVSASTPFPPSLLRKHLDTVQSTMAKAKINRALNAVAEGGFTLQEAALKFDVEPEKLKERFKKTRDKTMETALSSVKPAMTNKFRSLSASNGRTFRKLMEGYEDGVVTVTHIKEVVAHVRHHIKSMDETLDDWERRLLAASDPAHHELSGGNSELKEGKSLKGGTSALAKMGLS